MLRGSRYALSIALSTVLAACTACDRAKVQEPETKPSPTQSSAPAASVAPLQSAKTVALSDRIARAAPPRLVGIGDLHGDLDHARRALRVAGAIDDRDAWIGGKLVIVQTGDEIDRGDDDRAILDLFERLKADASKSGGGVIAMLGNHEIMNAQLDFRYVTPGALSAFSMMGEAPGGGALPADLDPRARGRAFAFRPGGTYGAMLARRPMVMKVGDSIFVHGGVLPKHVDYGLDKMNDEVADWLLAKRASPPAIVVAEDGPVWTRAYSDEASAPACAALTQTLAQLGAARMVVGHTVQHHGVTSACDGKVWRIDVGMARHYGGPIEVWSISGDKVSVLHE